MDVLHFLKEEYSAIRQLAAGIVPGDLAPAMSGQEMTRFMASLELAVRVGNDLILPELTDAGHGSSSVAILGEDQAKSLGRIIASFKKSGAIAEAKLQDLYRRTLQHLDHMEKAVLPLVRDVVSTPVREDIGEIALDYRTELTVSVEKSRDTRASASISA
jgi:hypothetical protein